MTDTAYNVRIDFVAAKAAGLTPRECRAALRSAGVPYERLFPLWEHEAALAAERAITAKTGVPMTTNEVALIAAL